MSPLFIISILLVGIVSKTEGAPSSEEVAAACDEVSCEENQICGIDTKNSTRCYSIDVLLNCHSLLHPDQCPQDSLLLGYGQNCTYCVGTGLTDLIYIVEECVLGKVRDVDCNSCVCVIAGELCSNQNCSETSTQYSTTDDYYDQLQ